MTAVTTATDRTTRPPLVHRELDNGVRLVVVTEPGSATATVAIHHGVGGRAEPPGRAGFAHLFEHLMFQGSPNLSRGEYRARLLRAGGRSGASTRADFTEYWSQVPEEALELAVWLEADRLRGLTISGDTLETEVSVVLEEIRLNIDSQPYGGFPWFDVQAALFRSFANAHDLYGDRGALEAVTLDDVDAFFDRYYVTEGVVLTVVSGVDPDAVVELVERHVGSVHRRSAPLVVDLDEPPLDRDHRVRRVDPLAPSPATAVGYRVPDPHEDLRSYLAAYLVDRLLTAGGSGRLQERLVRDDGRAHAVQGWFGSIDQPFGTRHPSLEQIAVHHTAELTSDEILGVVDQELGAIADGGLDDATLAGAVGEEICRYWTSLDPQVIRAIQVGTFELIHDRGELAWELPARLREVRVADVTAAASSLRGGARAVVEVVPGAGA